MMSWILSALASLFDLWPSPPRVKLPKSGTPADDRDALERDMRKFSEDLNKFLG